MMRFTFGYFATLALIIAIWAGITSAGWRVRLVLVFLACVAGGFAATLWP
jgi:hypothetical protein